MGYVAEVASAEPAPGGGSVVAVVAALAAALGSMVCNLTLGRGESSSATAELIAARSQAEALADRLLRLAPADEAAYRAYVVASRLPRATPDEKAARRAAMQQALVQAADVPLAVVAACRDTLAMLEPVARLGNRHALSDVAVAAYLADAAARGAALNVRINAGLMKDEARATSYRTRLAALLSEVGDLRERVEAVATANE